MSLLNTAKITPPAPLARYKGAITGRAESLLRFVESCKRKLTNEEFIQLLKYLDRVLDELDDHLVKVNTEAGRCKCVCHVDRPIGSECCSHCTRKVSQ